MTGYSINSKRQIALDEELLQHLGVRPGDKISIEKLTNGRIEIRAWTPTGRISDVFDNLKSEDGIHLTIEEINQIAAEGWAGKR